MLHIKSIINSFDNKLLKHEKTENYYQGRN